MVLQFRFKQARFGNVIVLYLLLYVNSREYLAQ